MNIRSLPPLVKSSLFRPLRDINPKWLFLIHIGKCGGSSLREATKRSRVVKNRFVGVRRFHFEKPEYSEGANYLFAVRNPILRSQSAFNYRRSLLELGGQEKLEGEREVFDKYPSFNSLAENLYLSGKLNEQAGRDWNSIHHLGDESIGFYVSDLLENLKQNQIYGVISVEHFSRDVPALLGITPIKRRVTSRARLGKDTTLTSKAIENLQLFLGEEFKTLDNLLIHSDYPTKKRRAILEAHLRDLPDTVRVQALG